MRSNRFVGALRPAAVTPVVTPGPAGGYPALVVAAADAPAVWKAVADYQASGANDQLTIQNAIAAVAAAGGGIVQLSPGLFLVDAADPADPQQGAIRVLDNCTLAGDGIDVTVIRVQAGSANDITGVVRTESGVSNHDVTIRDLTLDGNKGNVGVAARQIGFFCGTDPGSPLSDYDIRCYRVRCTGFNAYGFDPHAVTTRLVLEDCVADGNGALGAFDGFTLDNQIDARVERCRALDNGRHGFNVVTLSANVKLIDCLSTGNAANGFQIHDGSSGVTLLGCTGAGNGKSGLTAFGSDDAHQPAGPADVVDSWRAIACEFSGNLSSGVDAYALHRGALIDSLVSGNGTNGVTIQNLNGFAYGSVTVRGCTISDNKQVGVLVEGVPLCTITGNSLSNDCQKTNLDEIQLIALNAVDASDCLLANNLIHADSSGRPRMRYGISEAAGCDGSLVVGNRIVGAATAATSFSGAGTSANAAHNYAGVAVSGGGSSATSGGGAMDPATVAGLAAAAGIARLAISAQAGPKPGRAARLISRSTEHDHE